MSLKKPFLFLHSGLGKPCLFSILIGNYYSKVARNDNEPFLNLFLFFLLRTVYGIEGEKPIVA